MAIEDMIAKPIFYFYLVHTPQNKIDEIIPMVEGQRIIFATDNSKTLKSGRSQNCRVVAIPHNDSCGGICLIAQYSKGKVYMKQTGGTGKVGIADEEMLRVGLNSEYMMKKDMWMKAALIRDKTAIIKPDQYLLLCCRITGDVFPEYVFQMVPSVEYQRQH